MPIRKVGRLMPIERDRLEQLGEEAVAAQRRVDAHGYADEQREQRRHEGELQRRRGALAEQRDHRQAKLVGDAEFEPRGVIDVARELDDHRLVEAERLAQLRDLLLRRVDANHLVHRIADEAEHGEGDERDREHHDQRLEQPAQDKCEHGRPYKESEAAPCGTASRQRMEKGRVGSSPTRPSGPHCSLVA
jgi:hypothetical protein